MRVRRRERRFRRARGDARGIQARGVRGGVLYVRKPRAVVGRSRRDARDEGFQGEDRRSLRDVRENRGADVADEGLRWALDRTGALVPS